MLGAINAHPGGQAVESEHDLLPLARAGDATAFARLLEPHRSRLWSVALRITGNYHDAEDALQDALTAAWLNVTRFRGHSRFSTWIYRIVANAALMHVRRRRETPQDEAFFRDLALESHDERVLVRASLQAALDEMNPLFREALVLRQVGDLTYEEIAIHQGISVQTVKSRLYRARTALTNQQIV